MVGKCLWFDVKKGFGFVRSQEHREDIFVHYSKIEAPMGEFRVLDEGDIVEFELFFAERGEGTNKPQAKNVKVIGGKNEVSREHEDHSKRRHLERPETDKVL